MSQKRDNIALATLALVDAWRGLHHARVLLHDHGAPRQQEIEEALESVVTILVPLAREDGYAVPDGVENDFAALHGPSDSL